MQKLISHLELRIFLKMMHERYAHELNAGNVPEMMSAAGSLCLAYSSLGNPDFARRWADEFWRCWALSARRPVERTSGRPRRG